MEGEMIDRIPERIYLQWTEEDACYDQMTWCRDKINDSDVEYVRAGISKRDERMKELEFENYTVVIYETSKEYYSEVLGNRFVAYLKEISEASLHEYGATQEEAICHLRERFESFIKEMAKKRVGIPSPEERDKQAFNGGHQEDGNRIRREERERCAEIARRWPVSEGLGEQIANAIQKEQL